MPKVCSLAGCRSGALMMLNGLLHAMPGEEIGAANIVQLIE